MKENNEQMTKLEPGDESVVVFAARYAHHRNTGASLLVCNHIKRNWDRYCQNTQQMLQRETEEAQFNPSDWERITKLKVKAKS